MAMISDVTLRATREPSRDPWTLERTLHLLLAIIAISGWTLAYTALMRGAEPSQEIVQSEKMRTAISATQAMR